MTLWYENCDKGRIEKENEYQLIWHFHSATSTIWSLFIEMFSIQYSAIFYHYRTFGYEKILQHQTIVSNKYQKHFCASSYFTIFCVFMMLVLGSFSLLIWSKWGNSFSTTFCVASSEKGAWQVLTMETSEYLRSVAVSRMEKFYFFYKWFSWAHAQTL